MLCKMLGKKIQLRRILLQNCVRQESESKEEIRFRNLVSLFRFNSLATIVSLIISRRSKAVAGKKGERCSFNWCISEAKTQDEERSDDCLNHRFAHLSACRIRRKNLVPCRRPSRERRSLSMIA